METYLAFEKKYNDDYEAYKKKVMGMWGDDEMVDSTPKTWVDYSKDLTSRSNVDFEKGEVEIEVLVDVDQTEKDINKKLKDAVVDLVEAKDTLTVRNLKKGSYKLTVYAKDIHLFLSMLLYLLKYAVTVEQATLLYGTVIAHSRKSLLYIQNILGSVSCSLLSCLHTTNTIKTLFIQKDIMNVFLSIVNMQLISIQNCLT